MLALGLKLLLQAEIFLDAVHQTGAQLFLLPMHGQHRHPRAQPNDQMTAVTRRDPPHTGNLASGANAGIPDWSRSNP